METNTHNALPNFSDLLLDAVFLVDVHGRIVHVSAACEAIFGYTADEMIGQAMIGFVAPEDRARTIAESGQVMAGVPRIGFENRYLRKDGSRVHIMWSARWSEADQLRIGVARDVTQRKHAEAMQAATYAVSEAAHRATDLPALYREVHHILAALVPLAGLAVATCDPKTKHLGFVYQKDSTGTSNMFDGAQAVYDTIARHYCTRAAHSERAMLLPDDALAGLPASASDVEGDTCWLALPLVSQAKGIGLLILKSHPGKRYSDQEKELLQFVAAQVATASERRQLHTDLRRCALYDELTGLPNRRLFLDRVKSVLMRHRRKPGRMALLFIDIDDFKQVNDALGHATGDRLLMEIALRLSDSVRDEDSVARLGGDEFVVLLEEVQAPVHALHVADKIRDAIGKPVDFDGLVLRPGASIGIAVYPDHGTDTEQLLRHADKAMYAEKAGKARVA